MQCHILNTWPQVGVLAVESVAVTVKGPVTAPGLLRWVSQAPTLPRVSGAFLQKGARPAEAWNQPLSEAQLDGHRRGEGHGTSLAGVSF